MLPITPLIRSGDPQAAMNLLSFVAPTTRRTTADGTTQYEEPDAECELAKPMRSRFSRGSSSFSYSWGGASPPGGGVSEVEWKAWRWDILADDPMWVRIDTGSGYNVRAERLEKRVINFVQMLSWPPPNDPRHAEVNATRPWSWSLDSSASCPRCQGNETEENNSGSINSANAFDSNFLRGGYGLAGTE